MTNGNSKTIENGLNKSIRNEIAVANKMAATILLELSKDEGTTIKEIPHILDMALGMVKLCIGKAEDMSLAQKNCPDAKRSDIHKEVDEEKVRKAAEGLDKTFAAVVSLERFLAKREGREMNMRHLTRMARRMTKAFFKDVEGVDTSHIDINFSGKEANITIPKYQNDEGQ